MTGLGNKGFSLIEVLVAMTLFVVIIIISGSAFNKILSQSNFLQRSEESNVEGLIGLEMMRHDLQQAGFGLFTEQPPIDYLEVDAAVTPAADYNDAGGTAPSFHVPRALLAGNDLNGTISDESGVSYNLVKDCDYLVIKGTTVGRSKTAQKWTYMGVAGGVPSINTWPSAAENFDNTEYFVLLRRHFTSSVTLTIEKNSSDKLWFKSNSPAFNSYSTQGNDYFTIYGIDSDNFRMPFNRTDYFVARPANAPAVCSPNTGTLYKATTDQANGKLMFIPLLDCVADMQVLLGWDMDGNGSVDTWSNADGSVAYGLAPPPPGDVPSAITQFNNDDSTRANIRNRLKVVKVYIIAQNGKKDMGYTSPQEITIGDDGEKGLLHNTGTNPTKAAYALTADMINYRWKEHRVIVRPKNLLSNQ